jgi:phosphoribosylamine--glycine ligase
MGVIAPNPYCSEEVINVFNKEILEPTLRGIQEENMDYVGTVFFGIMITKKGVYLLEYNVRMGDPETQAVLSLMDSDYVEVILKALEGSLKNYEIKWKQGNACCVTAVAGGYPGKYEKGFEITGIEKVENRVFAAGADYKNGKLLTNGGRVLSVVAVGDTLDEARNKAYNDIEKVSFQGIYYRTDIGKVKSV